MPSEINKSSKNINENRGKRYTYEGLQYLTGHCYSIINLLNDLKSMKYCEYDFNIDERLLVF